MDCRTTAAVEFRTRLGLGQHDPIMTKIMTVFAAEEIILQFNILGYRVGTYLPNYKSGIEIDEQGRNDRPIDYDK